MQKLVAEIMAAWRRAERLGDTLPARFIRSSISIHPWTTHRAGRVAEGRDLTDVALR